MTKLHGITADEFDQRFPIGSTFNYFPMIHNPEFREVESRSPAWVLGHGTVVISVEGRAGCFSIEHIEPVSIGVGPAVVVRDNDGFWCHPAAPDFDEDTPAETYTAWYAEKEIEVKGHFLEDDSEELSGRWEGGDMSAVADWQPVPPDGEGWYLWSIFDTEDGPYCVFARRMHTA